MIIKDGNTYKPQPHRKKSKQGCGLGSKVRKNGAKGTMTKYRGQGGRRKSIKR